MINYCQPIDIYKYTDIQKPANQFCVVASTKLLTDLPGQVLQFALFQILHINRCVHLFYFFKVIVSINDNNYMIKLIVIACTYNIMMNFIDNTITFQHLDYCFPGSPNLNYSDIGQFIL